MLYPDPFLRADFDRFVDTCRAQSLRAHALNAEAMYWNKWLKDRDWLDSSPKPPWPLRSIAVSLEVGGLLSGIIGIVGLFLSWFSDLVTIYGFFAALVGALIDKYGRDIIQEDVEAVALVSRRLLVLARCHDRLDLDGNPVSDYQAIESDDDVLHER